MRPWKLCASFSYELVCHVAACVWVSMFAIWNLVFVQLFVYLFILGSRSRRHRPPRERWEEARGGRRPQPTMENPSPDDAGQTTGRRSRRAGRDEGGSRMLRRSSGGCTTRLGAAGTRGTMWKTASASPPSGGRPRLVADHTHKEPSAQRSQGRGPVPFYPSHSREVSVFIYLFIYFITKDVRGGTGAGRARVPAAQRGERVGAGGDTGP